MILREFQNRPRQIELLKIRKASHLARRRSPGGVGAVGLVTQVGAGRATPGWRTQSLWDWPTRSSFQPFPDFGGVLGTFKDRNHNEFARILEECEINRLGPIDHFYFLGGWAGERKSLRIFGSLVKHSPNLVGNSVSEGLGIRIIIRNGLLEFRFGLPLKEDPECHRGTRCRFSMSAKTFSIGRQSSGCARAAAARRSNSTICSRVNSSSRPPNPAQICSAISYCSAGGNRRICSSISTALMTLTYSTGMAAQAGFCEVGTGTSLTNPAIHLPYLASSRACKVSKEIMSSGWSRWSGSRRSINSASPGARLSSNLSRSCSNTSRCSATGSFSNRSMTCAAPTPLTYRATAPAPADLRPRARRGCSPSAFAQP